MKPVFCLIHDHAVRTIQDVAVDLDIAADGEAVQRDPAFVRRSAHPRLRQAPVALSLAQGSLGLGASEVEK